MITANNGDAEYLVDTLLVIIAGASAWAAAMIYRPDLRDPQPAPSCPTRWQTWYHLSSAERLVYVRGYRAVTRHTKAVDVFRRARAYAALPREDRERLQLLRGLLWDVINSQPAAHRRLLLSMHERARAEEVYRLLRRNMPHRLAEWRERVKPFFINP